MGPTLSRPSGWHQAVNRSHVQRALTSGELLTEIEVDERGHLRVHTTPWERYWGDPGEALPEPGARSLLVSLHQDWRWLAEAGFDREVAIRFCHTFFVLLRDALSAMAAGQTGCTAAALWGLLGFATFSIRWAGSARTSAAGTWTIHPAYLLAKLRQPDAYDDAKFLPLVTVYRPDDAPSLFYHYRQFRFSADAPLSMLLYPAVDLGARGDAFAAIDATAAGLFRKADPRGRQRASLISDLAVRPFLERLAHAPGSRQPQIEILDLGGGTGILTAGICQELLDTAPATIDGRKFACHFVDLRLQNPSRHFHSAALRRSTSCVEYEQADFRDWLVREADQPRQTRFDVALVCRLLNNFSLFSIEGTDDAATISRLAAGGITPDDLHAASYLPTVCLAPPKPSPEHLVASNRRARVPHGRSFSQLSLTAYFQGLARLMGAPAAGGRDRTWYPVRRFRPESLRLPNGRSILEALCRVAKVVVVEDVDLTASDLHAHRQENDLHGLAATEATDHVRMQATRLFCLAQPQYRPHLPGTPLW